MRRTEPIPSEGSTVKYAALIYTDERTDPEPGSAAQEELMQAYFSYGDEGTAAGVIIGGDALMPVAMATSVRVRDGETITTDGPFAETKEQLGGYYLVDCPDRDSALEWAAKCPAVHTGRVEVRPVADFEQN